MRNEDNYKIIGYMICEIPFGESNPKHCIEVKIYDGDKLIGYGKTNYVKRLNPYDYYAFMMQRKNHNWTLGMINTTELDFDFDWEQPNQVYFGQTMTSIQWNNGITYGQGVNYNNTFSNVTDSIFPMTKVRLNNGIYDGFDVAVHTLTHKSLKEYDNNPKAIRREVENDAENIYELTGVYPVGMAWPGGDNYVTETTKRLVFENTTIRFGRGITATHDFKLPEEFLMWQPTCSISDADLLLYADRFIEAECSEDMLFFVWGHGYELDVYQIYDRLEELIKMITEADDIVCVTTTEFYQLFKDQIPSLK